MGSAPLCGAKPASVIDSISNKDILNSKQRGSKFRGNQSAQISCTDQTEEVLSPETAPFKQNQTSDERICNSSVATNKNKSEEILDNSEQTFVYTDKAIGSSEHFLKPVVSLPDEPEDHSINNSSTKLNSEKGVGSCSGSKMMSINTRKVKPEAIEDVNDVTEAKDTTHHESNVVSQRKVIEQPILRNSAYREHHVPKEIIIDTKHGHAPDDKNVFEEEEDEDVNDDDDEKKDNKPLTEEELNELKTKTYSKLKTTASEVLVVEDKINEEGVYNMNIRNAILQFYNSYFTLKRGSLQQRIQFRLGIANILLETKFMGLVCDCLIRMYRRGWMGDDGKTNKKAYNPMINAVLTAVNFSDSSDAISIELANHKEYLETIKDILLKYAPRHLLSQEPKLSKEEAKLMKFCLSVAHNVSMRPNNNQRLRTLDFTSVMQPYLTSTDEMFSLTALATLASIVNEAESEIINAAHDRVKFLLKVLQKGLATKLRRCNGWSCKECGYTIRMIAQNDANKKLLVELGALELLVKLGRTGNEEEQLESVHAIWALSFDKDNQQKVVSTEDLGVLELLFELKKSENVNIKKACNGALWNHRDMLKTCELQKYRDFALKLEEDTAVRAKSEGVNKRSRETHSAKGEEKVDRGHVMISYQWSDQEIMKRIRDQLKLNGFRVWMDIDEMGGSTLQAMASAVENAELVLMCMSQKYKNSPNCRAEAEYAFQKSKKIIPLKMERGYVPDGWLGFICGAKLFYEFSGKYPFEDKMAGLLKEMGKQWNLGQEQKEPVIKPEIAKPVNSEPVRTVDHVDSGRTVSRVSGSNRTVETVRKWTDSDLKRWKDKNDLNSVLPGRITAGEVALLLQMKIDSPDFFYKCLHEMMKLSDLLSMSKLVWALQDIEKH
ncbi:uncharacterized protein LOC127864812 [Dreissena polymorpha]|uniref:uncharacterized protein LOC127864812 n=1 Tax=Dreissena polymorpha TaxID=45954 RepID=UPI0022650AB3|nr:uncharacterized protein LOC127864812 [Dreissena polymorpha]